MRDLIRCNNCMVVVKEEDARNWWTISRLYPIQTYGDDTEEAWDFCTEKCLNEWIDKRRARHTR